MKTSLATRETVAGFDDLDEIQLGRRSGVKWARAVSAGTVPAWVADMDYPLAVPIRQALRQLIDDGDLGYPNWPGGSPLRAQFAHRMADRYNWHPEADAVREQTDLIQALQLILRLASHPGDVIAIQTPNYPPFPATLQTMGLTAVDMPFIDTQAGWRIDFAAFTAALHRHRPKALVLVNPHNPTGRVHTRAELIQIAALAEEFDLLVISDEIHAELVYQPARHIPFASLSQDAAARTVTITSAGKAFNLAGLRCAIAHFGPEWLLDRRDAEPPDLYGAVSVPGVAATLAAWQHGDQWQDSLLAVLDRNRRRVHHVLSEQVPLLRQHLPEATYLAWCDVAALGIDDPVAAVRKHGRVMVDGGVPFARGAGQFIRINFATSSSILERILCGVVEGLTVTRQC
ncbi:aminotransferase class I/II-fold pyridoxal phosphate-dependent enzyme [soil metagenome]